VELWAARRSPRRRRPGLAVVHVCRIVGYLFLCIWRTGWPSAGKQGGAPGETGDPLVNGGPDFGNSPGGKSGASIVVHHSCQGGGGRTSVSRGARKESHISKDQDVRSPRLVVRPAASQPAARRPPCLSPPVVALRWVAVLHSSTTTSSSLATTAALVSYARSSAYPRGGARTLCLLAPLLLCWPAGCGVRHGACGGGARGGRRSDEAGATANLTLLFWLAARQPRPGHARSNCSARKKLLAHYCRPARLRIHNEWIAS
jgi:hypothetical protein